MAEQSGEWNQVKRRGGRLRNLPKPVNNAADSLSDGLRPNPNPELSVGDLLKYHKFVTEGWRTSTWWAQVRQIVESALGKPTCPVITKAVCLGSGPYEPSNGSQRAKWTAHMQTAAFCFLVEYLEHRTGRDITCVVQEPRFTQTDKEFCTRIGLTAVDTPEGFSIVDENTLLFGIHLELDIYNQALTKLPAVYVGSSLQEWKKVINHDSDTENPLMAFSKMDQTYDKFVFPDIDYMYSSTVMYWRRAEN
ncbi:hypothetical protein N657DRAFT_680098 [Parathielavia appendiculata]|uniref:SRR1-like domain-containing protein n=1 Tax=Parathielavia appendiculata TaxID=2587402 RepID=A0AAN6Z4W5_9PEZI|nr:hypothetical protein N657DRAFT_680098 [Parathielavia appendiculata]